MNFKMKELNNQKMYKFLSVGKVEAVIWAFIQEGRWVYMYEETWCSKIYCLKIFLTQMVITRKTDSTPNSYI